MNRGGPSFSSPCLCNETRPFPPSTPAQCRRYEVAGPGAKRAPVLGDGGFPSCDRLPRGTSAKGQNRKSSMRANVFRCSPNNGHCQDTSDVRFAPIPVTHELISVFVKSYQ